jgi:NAD(P)-dependent dehydrogenase (short-subunit alcohol dehydrogenase family)
MAEGGADTTAGERVAIVTGGASGIGIGGEICDYTIQDWEDVFDANLRGVVHGVQAVYPSMIEQGFGHIVNTASMAGLITTPMSGSYTTTKHAVVGLSKALRVEAKAYGVRVSVVCPGVIRTPILRGGRYGRINLPVSEQQSVERFERLRPMDPNLLAKKVLRAVFRNQAIIVFPRWWKLFWYLERISPNLSLRLAEIFLESARRDLRETPQ